MIPSKEQYTLELIDTCGKSLGVQVVYQRPNIYVSYLLMLCILHYYIIVLLIILLLI